MVSEDTTLPVVPQLLTCHILDSVSFAPNATVGCDTVGIAVASNTREIHSSMSNQWHFILSVKLFLKAIKDIKDAENLMNKFYNITGSCDFVTMAIK